MSRRITDQETQVYFDKAGSLSSLLDPPSPIQNEQLPPTSIASKTNQFSTVACWAGVCQVFVSLIQLFERKTDLYCFPRSSFRFWQSKKLYHIGLKSIILCSSRSINNKYYIIVKKKLFKLAVSAPSHHMFIMIILIQHVLFVTLRGIMQFNMVKRS